MVRGGEDALCTLASMSEALPLVADAYYREPRCRGGDGRSFTVCGNTVITPPFPR